MKIQILSLVNKKFEISVNSNDRVRTIKDKIQEIDGIPPDQMRLVFGGAQLEDEHLISDYNITENSKIHLVLKLRGGMAMKPNPIKIRIKYFENCSIIKVDPLISIKKLKTQIEQLTKIPVSEQILLCNEYYLKDDNKNLKDYSIGENSQIIVSCCLL